MTVGVKTLKNRRDRAATINPFTDLQKIYQVFENWLIIC